MTYRDRAVRVLAAVALLALAGAAAAIPASRSRGAAVRELRFVARGMTFYADGGEAPNPTVRVTRGERLRIVLRNEDSGMSHGLTIRAWDAGTPLVGGTGEAVLDLVAPGTAGEAAYSCPPHAAMMRGTIIVE
jgi:FtsP/CotA-like multicopper oxidase with cupredoxin domain